MRGRNEGSIYQRKDGRWAASITIGWENGKRRRKAFYGKTRAEVATKLTAALKAHQDGLPLSRERKTCGQFLDGWIESVKPTLRPRTWTRYESLIRIHALPEIGRLPLAKIGPEHLERLYARLLVAGQSPASVRQLHAVLHGALKQAARWGLVGRNVADLVSAPRVPRHEIRALSPDEAKRLLDAAQGERLEAIYVIALTAGLRLGELLALRWADVDTDAGTLRVTGTLQRTRGCIEIAEPKTKQSRRRVELTTRAIDALRRHKAAQNAERLALGEAWLDRDLVFCNERGDYLNDSHLRRRSFLPLLERAGLPRTFRFHDLRHSAASLLLGMGTHPKIVSEMLGHSTISITLDLYSHVTPTMGREAAVAMDAALGGG